MDCAVPNCLVVSGSKRKREEDGYKLSTVQEVAVTELEMEKFAFMWNIKQYLLMSESFNEIKSPICVGGPKSKHSWQLKLMPNRKHDGQDYLGIYLILTRVSDQATRAQKEVKARFEISLLGADGHPERQAGKSVMEFYEFKELGHWGYDKFILSSDLRSASGRYLEDNTLKVHCAVWIKGDLKHELHEITSGPSEHEKEEKRINRLSKDFGRLFDESVLTDIVISVANGKTFRAHKAVLAARSSVFSAMLAANMFPKNLIEIMDFDYQVVKYMLEYMYTGSITGSFKQLAPSLLQIAEKYDLPDLKDLCEWSIASQLTIENAADILLLANLYEATILKSKVVEFMKQNWSEVKKASSCKRLSQSNPSMIIDIFYAGEETRELLP